MFYQNKSGAPVYPSSTPSWSNDVDKVYYSLSGEVVTSGRSFDDIAIGFLIASYNEESKMLENRIQLLSFAGSRPGSIMNIPETLITGMLIAEEPIDVNYWGEPKCIPGIISRSNMVVSRTHHCSQLEVLVNPFITEDYLRDEITQPQNLISAKKQVGPTTPYLCVECFHTDSIQHRVFSDDGMKAMITLGSMEWRRNSANFNSQFVPFKPVTKTVYGMYNIKEV